MNQIVPVILVVEDEPLIQSFVEETLSEGGFEVAIVGSGEEAVALLIGQKTNYRALVTDINLLGRLDGWEVAKKAREIDPEFRIVYMSGAAAADWTSNGVPNSIMLEKPFAPAQLVTAPASAAILGLDLPPVISRIDLVVQFLHVAGADAIRLQQEEGTVEDGFGNRAASELLRQC